MGEHSSVWAQQLHARRTGAAAVLLARAGVKLGGGERGGTWLPKYGSAA